MEITLERSPGVTQVVEVVVTRDEWEEYATVIFATADPRDHWSVDSD